MGYSISPENAELEAFHYFCGIGTRQSRHSVPSNYYNGQMGTVYLADPMLSAITCKSAFPELVFGTKACYEVELGENHIMYNYNTPLEIEDRQTESCCKEPLLCCAARRKQPCFQDTGWSSCGPSQYVVLESSPMALLHNLTLTKTRPHRGPRYFQPATRHDFPELPTSLLSWTPIVCNVA